MRPLKVCIVSSPGGHLTEARCLRRAYESLPHFYVINDRIPLPQDMRERTYIISHAERDWKVLWNFVEALRILFRERPDVIMSTGAGPAVPFAIVGRFLIGAHIIFVETITRVSRPSLTARIVYPIAHRFYYQNEALKAWFPRGTFARLI